MKVVGVDFEFTVATSHAVWARLCFSHNKRSEYRLGMIAIGGCSDGTVSTLILSGPRPTSRMTNENSIGGHRLIAMALRMKTPDMF